MFMQGNKHYCSLSLNCIFFQLQLNYWRSKHIKLLFFRRYFILQNGVSLQSIKRNNVATTSFAHRTFSSGTKELVR